MCVCVCAEFFQLLLLFLPLNNTSCSFCCLHSLFLPVYGWASLSLLRWINTRLLAKLNCIELFNHDSYLRLLNPLRWSSRSVLKGRMLWQAYLSDNALTQFGPNIWTLTQTDAGNKEIARGATLAEEVSCNTLPRFLHFHNHSYLSLRGWFLFFSWTWNHFPLSPLKQCVFGDA